MAERLYERFARRARVKVEGVSEPPRPWNGVKAMLVLKMADGAKQHPQIQMAAGTIRGIAPGKPVVFEPSLWGGPDGLDVREPLELDRVIGQPTTAWRY